MGVAQHESPPSLGPGRGENIFLTCRGEHGGLAIPFIGIDRVINVKPEAEGEGGDSRSGQLPIAQILPLSTFRRPLIPRNRTLGNDKETRRSGL